MLLRRWSKLFLLIGCLSLGGSLQAAEVTFTMPDAVLERTIFEVCAYHGGCAGAETLEAKAQLVAEKLVRLISLNHYASLAEAGMTMRVQWE